MTQFLQIGILGQSVRRGIIGEAVTEVFGQVQRTAFCDFQGIGDSFGIGLKKRFQFRHRAEVKLGIRTALAVGFLQALAILDGDQTVLQLVTLTEMVMDVAGRGDFNPAFGRQFHHFFVAFGFTEDQVALQFQVIIIRAEPFQVATDKIFGFN